LKSFLKITSIKMELNLALIAVKILFFCCLGVYLRQQKKRLQRKAGIWITDKAQMSRSLIKEC